MLRWSARILLFLGAVALLTGCASSQSVSNESTFTINVLEDALQKDGIFVMPNGPANLAIPADQSSRLILNSSEVLHVFEFESAQKAHNQAHAFAGAHPQHDVYLKDLIVAVRQSRGDTGLTGSLRSILGETL